MNSSYNHINILILYIIILIKEVTSVDFSFPSAISLPNGNIFIVEKEGIFVYDEQLMNIIHNYPFETEAEKISDVNSLSNIIIKFQDNYIISLINLKIYFFDSEGNKLLITDKIITDENFSYPDLIPINLGIANSYHYVIGYFLYEDSKYKLKLILYKINLLTNNNEQIKELVLDVFRSSRWGNNRLFANKGLACGYMQHIDYNTDNFLVCFFIFNKDSTLSLSHHYFQITDSSLEKNTDYKYGYIDNLYDVKQIKMVTRSDRKESMVCLLFTNEDLECNKFYYPGGLFDDSGQFYQNIITNFNCRSELYGMKLNYLTDDKKIVLSCINNISLVQALFFDDNLNSKNSYEQFTNCTSIYGHSVLILKNSSAYYVISDAICDNVKRSFEPLEGSLSPIQIIDIVTPTQISGITNSFEVEKENGEETGIEKEVFEEEKNEEEGRKETKIEEEIEIEEEKQREEKGEEKKEENEEKEKTEIIEDKFDCSTLEKCGECDKESFDDNLCIKCNEEKNYYYLNNYL